MFTFDVAGKGFCSPRAEVIPPVHTDGPEDALFLAHAGALRDDLPREQLEGASPDTRRPTL
ncbi:hypothetical protein [Micromonospora sp. NBRC 101691]|uniref:hypothetical protein n=1 Tax=Micromonospora sp. NBRC 101691 TaxID=3032198 RepID=UPI0024A1AAA7|nr:hypothetical protein [Micromonospora sp. NBRC 101691]GLY23825.1 hypothetical protein Misp04_35570 [Micromonospora sp. NBRC 101691]